MILVIVLSILLLDQSAKYIVSKALPLNESLPLIKGALHLTLVHNRGAAFGILKEQTGFFIFTSVFSLLLIYFGLKKRRQEKISIYTLSLAFIAAGAIGNLIDRVRFGYVIDFLDLRVWPVFNVADSAITIGAVLLGWSVLTSKEMQSVKRKT